MKRLGNEHKYAFTKMYKIQKNLTPRVMYGHA